MGTWHTPQSKADKDVLRVKVKQLKAMREDILDVFGDDIMLDSIETLIQHLQFVIKLKIDKWAPTQAEYEDSFIKYKP